MTIRIDASLGSPARGPAPGHLGASEPPVVLVGPATTSSFLLEGSRVAVVGDQRRGNQSIWIDGTQVLGGLTTDGGAGVNVVSAPASLRRELLGTTSLLEHTLALPTLPLAVVQWAPPPGGLHPGSVAVTFTLLPGAHVLRYHASEGGVRASPGEAGTWTVDAQTHPPPSAVSVSEEPSGGLVVQMRLTGSGPLTLLVAGGPNASAARTLSAGAHLGAHEIRAAAEADPHRSEGLSVVTGVDDVDHALVWAASRVRHALRRNPSTSADETFWTGLGALAMGDDEGARSAVEGLQTMDDAPAIWPLEGVAGGGPLALLLAARYTLTTGDTAPAGDAHAALLRKGLDEVGGVAGPEEWAVWSLALNTLADALRHAAPEDAIGTLRDAAARPTARGGVRLPMVGTPPASTPVALHHLLAPVWPPPTLTPLGDSETPLEGWALWAAGDADAAWAGWRRQLGGGLADLDTGRGCWDPISPPGGAPNAALLLCGLAHGLLALSPDAPSGRIRIAPALPGHVTAFEVRRIRVGEARLTLRYRREGEIHRFELEPTRGRVPPMVVFEPSIPCTTVASTRVDGDAADIEVQPMARRSRVRIQLPLDGNRTLEVEEGVQ